MVKVIAEPRRPVEDWHEKLDAWVTEIRQLIEQAKTWAEKRQWATKQDLKVISEENIGTYEAPTLLIHTPQGRLLLDPTAKSVVGADGRLDFCVMPSYDSVSLVKSDGVWELLPTSRDDAPLPWCEESFERVALELLNLQ